MTHAYRSHSSGLLVAEQSQDHRQVEARLRQIDDRLVLWAPDGLNPYWRVMRRISDDRPAMPVLAWMAPDGDPLPLSSGLVDEVTRLRRDSRYHGPDADKRNQQHVDQIRKLREDSVEAIHSEYEDYLERGRKGVTFARVGKKRYWQRDKGIHR